MIKSIIPKDIPIGELHSLLLGAVSPRPIAFASTIDTEGNVNLSPFSFFNVFSANPPIMIFSPARRVRGNTTKHTLENAMATKEVVINIVNYAMVQQMSLASAEYGLGINEFTKAGFTEVPSETVEPPRVGESPVSFECKVNDIVHLGTEGGAGNLIICEVTKIHLDTDILDKNGKIEPDKIDTVARMGGNWYSRASGDSIFEIPKPISSIGIGFDTIPSSIRNSKVLTGNELGQLGTMEEIPSPIKDDVNVNEIIISGNNVEERLHQLAKGLLAKNKISEAWAVLMANK
ncbi:MAG: flavin reductase family protein [Cyclobacteriaceae bacterium]|nr:flavin reductase family protein [Cyclobacteriaceae bacterium]